MSVEAISILIPAFREAINLPRALASCQSQQYPDFEILVGVEQEDQPTTEALQPFLGPTIQAVLFPTRTSVCEKINVLTARCRGSIIVKMDADMLWGHAHCLRALAAQYDDPRVGGVSLVGDRGVSDYTEIFSLVSDPVIRAQIIHERTKSLSARGENTVGRLVTKFRQSLFPLTGPIDFPFDIHSARRALMPHLDQRLIHDDAQIAYAVLRQGFHIHTAAAVVLLHLGAPDSFHKLSAQKRKGRAGWQALKHHHSLHTRRYYAHLLRFIARHLPSLSPMDFFALWYWLISFGMVKLQTTMCSRYRPPYTWTSPR